MGILEGKVVWVTGGGNGIGKDCALIAAKEGAAVVVNDLGGGFKGDASDSGSAGPAEEVAREIRAGGGKAISNSDSVTDFKAMEALRDQTLKELGGLDGVINPAGILRDAMFHKMTEFDWDKVIEVHLRGSFNVCRTTIEHFREKQSGSYALFTSTSGLIGNIGQTNYAAAKLGIMGLSRVLAMEGAKFNVRSNIIAPVAWTRMTQSVPIRDEAQAKRREQMAALIRPDQPAKLAVALISDLAKEVSGQIFGARGETIELYSQPRPIMTLTEEAGWTPEKIATECFGKMQEKFFPVSRSATSPQPEQKAS
ncbi:MAG: SDR family NAD(P)-dependent oxidoreductase [Proteobacteria bacterium]|nr:SDR family NAD(P)-dependent oxidoreductase [Pseudomonadota bacterium]